MNIEKIRQIAYASRAWTQEYQGKHFKHFSECLGSLCAIASAHLSNTLTVNDIQHKIALCDTARVVHCFIICDNHIIDITATQFGYQYNPVEIIDMQHLDIKEFPFWEVSTCFDDTNSLLAYQKLCGWEKIQRVDACKELIQNKIPNNSNLPLTMKNKLRM